MYLSIIQKVGRPHRHFGYLTITADFLSLYTCTITLDYGMGSSDFWRDDSYVDRSVCLRYIRSPATIKAFASSRKVRRTGKSCIRRICSPFFFILQLSGNATTIGALASSHKVRRTGKSCIRRICLPFFFILHLSGNATTIGAFAGSHKVRCTGKSCT